MGNSLPIGSEILLYSCINLYPLEVLDHGQIIFVSCTLEVHGSMGSVGSLGSVNNLDMLTPKCFHNWIDVQLKP